MSGESALAESVVQTEARVRRWQQSPQHDIVHFAIRLVDRNAAIGFCHLAAIDAANRRCKVGVVMGERQ